MIGFIEDIWQLQWVIVLPTDLRWEKIPFIWNTGQTEYSILMSPSNAPRPWIYIEGGELIKLSGGSYSE